MRSALIIILTMLVLAAGFGAYVYFQPRPSVTVTSAPPAATPLQPNNSGRVTGAGQSAWIKSYDEKTGRLSNQFRAEKYDPQKDGTVDVVHPVADFFMADGKVVRITGDRGKIQTDNNPAARKRGGGFGSGGDMPSGPPSRGALHDVTIALLDSPDAMVPNLTATMDNAAFDNETSRLYTDSYTDPATGKTVDGDQVPVVVRGIDYDFDGKGLTLRWNQRDSRLQLLEIAHGQQLTIKNPSKLSTQKGKGGVPGVSLSQPLQQEGPVGPLGWVPTPPLPEMFVQADGVAPPPASVKKKRASTQPRVVKDTSTPLYHATFNDNVHVTQGGQADVTGDVMQVDFQLESSRKATTRATTGPGTGSEQTVALDSAAEKPTDAATANAPSLTNAPAGPVTQPTMAVESPTTAPVPVVIRWTGKLRVIPLETQEARPIEPGQSIIDISGSPTHIEREGNKVDCASLIYDTADATIRLLSSTRFPVVHITGTQGAVVDTTAVDYLTVEHQAMLHGKSHARFPMQQGDESATPASTTQPAAVMDAEWTRLCTLRFATTQPANAAGGDELAMGGGQLESVNIEGDAHITHPQFQLKADALKLAFGPGQSLSTTAPTTTQPSSVLKEVYADGNVSSVFKDPKDATAAARTIACDRLRLQTEMVNGKPSPHYFDADGSVHATDPSYDLHASHLTATLSPSAVASTAASPTTAPAPLEGSGVQLDSLVAHEDVKVVTKDGATATSDSLTIERKADDLEMKLLGQPAAKLTSGTSVLTGPIIQMFKAHQRLIVLGAGTLQATQQDTGAATRPAGTPAPAPHPIHVTWTNGMVADGEKDDVTATGGVLVTSLNNDGSVGTAKGDTMKMKLADAPTTHPSTPPPAAGADASLQSGLFKDKVVKTITLLDNVEFINLLSAPNGSPLRQLNLLATEARIERDPDRFVVPVPGRLLFVDRRPPATRPASQPAGGDPENLSQSRGNTAVQWNKDLIYDTGTEQAVLSGGVTIVHDAQGSGAAGAKAPESQSFRLDAQTVTIDVVSAPTTQPASPAAGADESHLQFKHMRAEGNVHFASRGNQLDGTRMDYDPGSHQLTVFGTDDAPVHVTDDRGMSGGTFGQVTYDLITGHITGHNMQARLRR